jgi:nucleoid DNA-binding protein
MIKADIINQVAEEAAITKVKAIEAVEAVFEAMKAAMMRGERIELRGFGFSEAAQKGIGQPRPVAVRPPGKTIRFKPGKNLKPRDLRPAPPFLSCSLPTLGHLRLRLDAHVLRSSGSTTTVRRSGRNRRTTSSVRQLPAASRLPAAARWPRRRTPRRGRRWRPRARCSAQIAAGARRWSGLGCGVRGRRGLGARIDPLPLLQLAAHVVDAARACVEVDLERLVPVQRELHDVLAGLQWQPVPHAVPVLGEADVVSVEADRGALGTSVSTQAFPTYSPP